MNAIQNNQRVPCFGARPARANVMHVSAPRRTGLAFQTTAPKRRTVVMGLPIVPILSIAYAAGAFKFWGGFSKTTFEEGKKAQLTALWPLLFVASEAFRKDFQRAISD